MIDLHPELARMVLEHTPAGTALLDTSGVIVWANDEFARICETTPDQMVGKGVRDTALPFRTWPTDSSERITVASSDGLICSSQPFESPEFRGRLLLMIDRGQVLKDHLSTLASGSLNGLATTGLLTREALSIRLEAEISRSRRYSNPLSCVVACAAEGGGLPVESLVRLLREHLRWVDVIGRWDDGGVVVLLPETTGEAAAQIVEKLEAVAGNAALDGGGQVTWGMAAWSEADTPSALVERAVRNCEPEPAQAAEAG